MFHSGVGHEAVAARDLITDLSNLAPVGQDCRHPPLRCGVRRLASTSALPRMLRILRRPRPPCGASSGACGSCGPPAVQEGGRLAADAAHRAAQSVHCYCSGSGGRCCFGHRQVQRKSECEGMSIIGITRIGNIDSFDNIGNIGNIIGIGEIENYCQRERCVTLYGLF